MKLKPRRFVILSLGVGMIVCVALCPLAGTAWAAEPAEPTNEDRALALTLFRRGRELMESRDIDGACRSFEQSQHLDPGGGTLLNLAVCHEEQGRVATAWTEFAQGLAQARRDSRTDRIELAQAHISALEPKLTRLVITRAATTTTTTTSPSSTSNLRIVRDGHEIPREAWGVAVPVDPGEHRIEAFEGETRVFFNTITIEAKPGATTTVRIAYEPSAPPAPPAEQPLATVSPTRTAESRTNEHSTHDANWRPIVGWSLVTASALSVGLGSFFGLRAFAERRASDDQCIGGRCSAESVTSNERAKTAADVATVGFIAGAALAIAGVYLLVATPNRPHVNPVVR